MGIVMKADGPAGDWILNVGENGVHLILSEAEIAAAEVPAGDVAGFPVSLTMLSAGSAVPGDLLAKAKAVVVELQPGSEASMQRLARLRASWIETRSRSLTAIGRLLWDRSVRGARL